MSIFKGSFAEFRYLGMNHVYKSLYTQYQNPDFLTPHYQKISYSQDMLKYLRYLQRRNTVSYKDLRGLVENLLTQYHLLMAQDRPNVRINLQKDVVVPQSRQCQFHGKVDWMYSIDGFNPTPVMHFEKQINPYCGMAMALSNFYMRKQKKQQFQKQYKSDVKKYEHANSYSGKSLYGYSIVTTGHEWQLFRIDQNFRLQKSLVLQGNNKYRTIYHDQQMVTVVLGMLDYCLQLPMINVRVLQKAYQYLDERKHMIQGENQDQIKGASPVSKLLLRYYKNKL